MVGRPCKTCSANYIGKSKAKCSKLKSFKKYLNPNNNSYNK